MRSSFDIRRDDARAMSPPVRATLVQVAGDLSREEKLKLEGALPFAAAEARSAGRHWDFAAPANTIDRWLATTISTYRNSGTVRLKKAAVARLALEHFAVSHHLPKSIAELYPAFFDRLARSLAHELGDSYEADFFCKDVRYALGLTVPCGALQFDLDYRIGPKLIFRHTMRQRSLRAGLGYAANKGWGRWYNHHLDTRDLSGFHPRGWTDSFLRIAETLQLNSHIQGVAGLSWFYDPALTAISPDLAYILRTQTENGAFLVRVGPGPEHTENATRRSFTRRRLCNEGKYVPTGFLIAWPRRAVIAWARRLEEEPELGFGRYANA